MPNLAQDFLDYINDWHTYNEPYDDDLDIWLHEEYAKVIRKGKDVDWRSIYFSPSSAGNSARELYVKAKKKRKDQQRFKPHQRRWMSLGTAVGDWFQRELLLAERHYKKLSGKEPVFSIGLVNGQPAFEDFVFKQHKMTWKGEEFSLLGTTDGIMIDRRTGEKIGLEIKSKQETPSKTSLSAMKEADPKHVKQCVSYGEMYGLDRFIIVYINTAKKKWFAPDDELEKTPDVRAFEIKITEDMRNEVFDYFADIVRRVRENDPPKLDLEDWRFNRYKRACALDLSEDEMSELESEVVALELSNLPQWKVRACTEALDEIKAIRGDS